MKENIRFKYIYSEKGFFVGQKVLDYKQTQNLRKLIFDVFRTKGNPSNLSIDQFKNQTLENKIIKLFSSKEILQKINYFNSEFQTDVCLLPHFEIMLNHHTSRSISLGLGWHRDCNGELKYSDCKYLLRSQGYIFGKVGIYLQENNDFGGGIDLIPESHKHILNPYMNLKKILNFLILKFITKFPFKKNSFFTRILEPFSFYLLKAIKLKMCSGQFVLFDSRLLHRGSPIEESKSQFVKQIKEKSNDFFEVPEKFNKISIYCQYGSKKGIKSYMRDRNLRSKFQEQVMWNKQINIINKKNEKLASSISSLIA